MTRVEAIEREVETLSPEELAAFRDWFAEFDAATWDRRIAADAKAGKLEGLAAEALADYEAGKCKDL